VAANPEVGLSNGHKDASDTLQYLLPFQANCETKPSDVQKRFVSLWLPHLASDWFAARQPHLKIPLFLKAPSHGRIIVTASSPTAQAGGTVTGMPLADAKAIFPMLHVFDDVPKLSTQLLQRTAEWCIRSTPAAAPDANAGILLDATGCAPLWGS
jgi:protein ImuB